jgi:hypothetical protein
MPAINRLSHGTVQLIWYSERLRTEQSASWEAAGCSDSQEITCDDWNTMAH